MRELNQGDRPSHELIARCIAGLATPDEEAQVHAWRAAAHESEREYRRIERLLSLSARLPEAAAPGPAPAAETVLARVAEGRSKPAKRMEDRRSRLPGGPWGRFLAAAVIVGITVPAAIFLARSTGAPGAGFTAEAFLAGPSETATIALRDGTVVRLAPDSRLRLEPSDAERIVRLDGRGYFAVAHRPGQPFVVRTRSGEVRVLGTRFDLSARDDDLQLLVIEGRVAMSASGLEAEVRARQLSRVIKGVPLPVVEVEDPHELTAWVGQFLAFQATPLADAAREIARHYGVRIEVTDPALARRTVTGWFSGWSLDDVMTVVCTIAEASCRGTAVGFVVEPFPQPSRAR